MQHSVYINGHSYVTRAMKRYEHVWAPFCRRALRGVADAGSCENRPGGDCDRERLDEADVLEFKEMVRAKLRSFAAGELLTEDGKAAGVGVGLQEPSNEAPSPPPQVLRVPLEKLDTVLRTAFIDVLGEQPFDALLKHSLVRFQCILVHLKHFSERVLGKMNSTMMSNRFNRVVVYHCQTITY